MKCLTAPHLEKVFAHPTETVHEALKTLSSIDFDVIVVCGLSGMVLGSIVASAMKKRLAVVRKEGERTVSGMAREVEGWRGGRYIFFDDLISTGGTRRHACRKFNEASTMEGFPSYFVGTYTYDYDTWSPSREECPTHKAERSQLRSYYSPPDVDAPLPSIL